MNIPIIKQSNGLYSLAVGYIDPFIVGVESQAETMQIVVVDLPAIQAVNIRRNMIDYILARWNIAAENNALKLAREYIAEEDLM